MRQHEAVVKRCSPANQAAVERPLPEHANQSPDQQHLHKTHAHMRRHFESSQFEQAKSQPEALRRIQLVDAELGAMRVSRHIDKQVAKQSIDNVRRTVVRRQMAKGNLEFIQGIHARFVHARILACRPDIHSGKQIRQRRVVLPERHHAAQQIRPPQEGAVRHGRAADHDVAAAAGGVVAAVVSRIFQRSIDCVAPLRSSIVLICSSSSQLLAGGRLTSSTPGSGVTLNDRSRGSAGGA